MKALELTEAYVLLLTSSSCDIIALSKNQPLSSRKTSVLFGQCPSGKQPSETTRGGSSPP